MFDQAIEAARAWTRSDAGFTMIEIVVSALVVALLAAGLALALIDGAHVSGDQRMHSLADEVAQQDQERLRGLSAQELIDINGQQRTVTVGTNTFTVTSTAQFLSSSGGTSCGASGNGAAAYFKTVSSVNWTGNLRPPVVEQSIITPPGGGVLLTQVEDQNNNPVAGVTVSAGGPDAASATTDASGCVVLAGLNPGSYTLTLTQSGTVDPDGNPSPLTRSATVTASGTATPTGGNPVRMAQPGMINASFTTKAVSGAQQADAFSWYGNGATYGMSAPKTYGPVSSPATLLPSSGTEQLYPFTFNGGSYTNNYQVWAGKCQQMRPPTGTDQTTVMPSQTQTVPVQEPGLDVIVTYGGTRVAPAHVKIGFQSATGPSCSDSWYTPVAANAATSSTGSLAAPGQPFASTATSGSSESASGYTGTLSVCADYSSHEATVSNVTNTNFGALTSVTVALTSNSTQGTC